MVRDLAQVLQAWRDDPAVLAMLEKFDQSIIYMGTEDYTRFARETFVAEKATIERLGMAAKS